MAIKKNAFYINQFDNKANLASHYNMLGPEIYNQLRGKIDAFVADTSIHPTNSLIL